MWEGMGGLGMNCEWLAGLVYRVCLYGDYMDGLGCEKVSVRGAGFSL